MIVWIKKVLPKNFFYTTKPGALIVNACPSHRFKKVKEYRRNNNIKLILIPGELTPYLQAADIAVFRSLKKNYLIYLINGRNLMNQLDSKDKHELPQPAVVEASINIGLSVED